MMVVILSSKVVIEYKVSNKTSDHHNFYIFTRFINSFSGISNEITWNTNIVLFRQNLMNNILYCTGATACGC